MTAGLRPYFVVPMKDPALSKTRLQKDMPLLFCEQLATEMFRRTITVIRREFADFPLLVVTASVRIARLALSQDCLVLNERPPHGLNQAANAAVEWGLENGYDTQILVHADIPLIDRDGLERVVSKVSDGSADVAICRSWSGGTSILATKVSSKMPFLFGPNSTVRHLNAARSLGLRVSQVHVPHMEMDLDTVEDLEYLLHESDLDALLNQQALQ